MIGKAIYLILGFAYPCAFCASFPREKVSSHRLEPLILSLSQRLLYRLRSHQYPRQPLAYGSPAVVLSTRTLTLILSLSKGGVALFLLLTVAILRLSNEQGKILAPAWPVARHLRSLRHRVPQWCYHTCSVLHPGASLALTDQLRGRALATRHGASRPPLPGPRTARHQRVRPHRRPLRQCCLHAVRTFKDLCFHATAKLMLLST